MKQSLARSRSEDPAQEHLREKKSLWNKSVSNLISKLISFKKGINGRGDSKFGLPESTIKEPFPSEIGSFLNQMADESLAIINGAEEIISEQENYSKARQQAMLMRQASWFGSRFLANNLKLRKTPTLKKMLLACVRIEKNIEDLENILSSSSLNSIPRAVAIAAIMAEGSAITLANLVLPLDEKKLLTNDNVGKEPESEVLYPYPKFFPDSKNEESPDTEKVPSFRPEVNDDKVDLDIFAKIKKDVFTYGDMIVNFLVNEKGFDRKKIRTMLSRHSLDLTESDLIKSPEKFAIILSKYKASVKYFKTLFTEYSEEGGKLVPEHINTFEELFNYVSLNKTAGPVDYLKRLWFKNKPDFLRKNVDIDDLKKNCIADLHQANDKLNELMNSIEAKHNSILVQIDEFSSLMRIIFRDLARLGKMYNAEASEKRIPEKSIRILDTWFT